MARNGHQVPLRPPLRDLGAARQDDGRTCYERKRAGPKARPVQGLVRADGQTGAYQVPPDPQPPFPAELQVYGLTNLPAVFVMTKLVPDLDKAVTV